VFRSVERNAETYREHIGGFVFGFRDLLKTYRVTCINTLTLLRCSCSTAASYLGFGALQFSGSRRVNDALYPSKSGLLVINKHTVKQYPGDDGFRRNILSRLRYSRPPPVRSLVGWLVGWLVGLMESLYSYAGGDTNKDGVHVPRYR